MMGFNVALTATENVDGVQFGLYEASDMDDNRAVVRMMDEDSGCVIAITSYPTRSCALTAYEDLVTKSKK